ncbi:MAG: GAF domain-containing protein [Pseudomonadota bacterium]
MSQVFAEAESDLPALLRTVAEQVANRFGDTCAITLRAGGRRGGHDGEFTAPVFFDGESRAARILNERAPGERAPGTTEATAGGEGGPLPVLDDAVVRDVARTGRALAWQSGLPGEPLPIFAQPALRPWLDEFPVGAAAVVPLRVRDRVIGVVVCARRAGRRPAFSVDESALLQEVADRAAIAIENARLVAELNAANEEMDVLYELTDAVNRAESLDGVYAPALTAILQQHRLERCALLLFDTDGVLRFKAWRGLSDEYRRAVEGHSPWRQDEADAAALAVDDVYTAPDLAAYRAVFEAEGIRALVFIPLAHAGRLLGKFMLYRGQARGFSPAEIRRAQAIADQVAAAVGQKQIWAEREQMIEKLTHTVELNERLAGILSHDLRNPLGAILMSATVLSRKITDPSLARTAARILTSGQRMNRMISQLLDFTRVRAAGSILVEPARTDLEHILRQAVEESVQAAPSGVAVPAVDFDIQGDTRGWWDGDRLAQVASNLVSNAFRHAAPGSHVTIRVDGRDAGWVTSAVQNVGAIPDQVLPLLFEPAQPDRPRNVAGGLGLGLFIGREIVVAHGGALDVTSASDTTTFLVRLPRGGLTPAGGSATPFAR